MIAVYFLKASLLLVIICSTSSKETLPVPEIILVQNSMRDVESDSTKNGKLLLLNFFKRFPKYQTLFPFKDVPFEDLAKNAEFSSFSATMIGKLSATIFLLRDKEMLVDMLHNIGGSLTDIHAPQSVVPDFKSSIMYMLQEALGPKFTDDVKSAYNKTLGIIGDRLIEGMIDPPE